MAGSGSRFGGPVPKVFADLGGRPIWRHAAATLAGLASCRRVILVVAAEYEADVRDAAADMPLARVVAGGERRQDSVRHGLAGLDVAVDVVAVHDAARPLLRAATALEAIQVAADRGAALVAVPVSDTVKEVAPDGVVVGTPDRSRLWRAQTPQCFRTELLLRAHEQALRDGIAATDDAALVELLGHAVPVVQGEAWNLKVTEPEDLTVAQALLDRRAREETA